MCVCVYTLVWLSNRSLPLALEYPINTVKVRDWIYFYFNLGPKKPKKKKPYIPRKRNLLEAKWEIDSVFLIISISMVMLNWTNKTFDHSEPFTIVEMHRLIRIISLFIPKMWVTICQIAASNWQYQKVWVEKRRKKPPSASPIGDDKSIYIFTYTYTYFKYFSSISISY